MQLVNKVRKDTKGHQKNYAVTEKSGIKRDMEKKMGQTEDKEQDDLIKPN